jgi:hypothetical protein
MNSAPVYDRRKIGQKVAEVPMHDKAQEIAMAMQHEYEKYKEQ